MPAPPYMRFYVDAYCKATLQLTFEEQGVFMRLLCTMWKHGGKIADDDRLISKALPIQIQKWQKVKPQLLPHLIVPSPGYLSNKKLSEQFNSVAGEKPPNDGSASAQPPGGRGDGPTQQPTQGPTQRPYQGPPQGSSSSNAAASGSNDFASQRLEDIPVGGVAHMLARALDQSRERLNQDKNSRLLEDGSTEFCGKLPSDDEASSFVNDAIDAFEKYRLHPPGDYSVVKSWIGNGCDLTRHILPAIKAALSRQGTTGKPPKSWKYFTHEVYARKKKENANG